MKRDKLVAALRESTGHNRALRREGNVPAVLYGSLDQPLHLSLSERDVDKFLRENTTGGTVDLIIDGKTYLALFKDLQIHPVKQRVLHLDFQALSADVKVKVTIPIVLNIAEQDRGIMVQQLLNEVDIEALPRHLVSQLDLDIDRVEVGAEMLLKDHPIMQAEGIEVLTDPERSIYNVVEVRAFVEPTEGEEAEAAVDAEAVEEVDEADEE